MVDGDTLHFLCLAVIDVSAILANLFLIIAIIWSTPSIMRSYSTILLFMATIDCVAAFMSLLGTVMVENLEGSVIFIYTGPCKLIHAQLCYAANALHVQAVGESCALLLVSFSYRLMSVSASINISGNRTKPFIICLLATIPAVLSTITFFNSPQPPPQKLLDHPLLAGRIFSIFNMTATNFISTENILPRISIGYILSLSTIAPTLFILRRKLLQKIRRLGSSSEKQSHQHIFRSHTLQMLLPLSFCVTFSLWIIDFLEIYRLEAFQRGMMIIASAFPLLSPLINIYYLPSYRKFGSKLLHSIPKLCNSKSSVADARSAVTSIPTRAS